jgi:aminoglycoside phosphotransferase
MRENAKAQGTLEIKIFKDTGELVSHSVHKNLIVAFGKYCMAQLLGLADADRRVGFISFGESGTAPTTADVAPLNNPTNKNVAGVLFPSTTSVQFVWTLELLEGNGKTLREFGLLDMEFNLFSRLVRDPIVKDNTIRLEGTWTIQF